MSGAHPERIIPAETSPGIIEHHLAKYRFAMAIGLAGPVLDAACGVGYASAFVARRAGVPVVGVDISSGALALAATTYAVGPTSFCRADVARLPFHGEEFGSVLGFETVEHVVDQGAYVHEVRRVLRAGGRFVCSTPYVALTDPAPINPFHVRELDPHDFRELLRASFHDVELFSQVRIDTPRARVLRRIDVLGLRRRVPSGLLKVAGRATGTPATADRSAADFEVVPGVRADATEILAFCW